MNLNRLEINSNNSNFLIERNQATSKASKSLNLQHLIASTNDLSPSISVKTTKKPIEDSLLKELEQALHIQATQIEKDLQEIESNKRRTKAFGNLLEAESWGYESISFINENLREGIYFLDNILPPRCLEQIPAHYRLERIGYLTALGGVFLEALNSGSHGLALICRTKILQQSRELLEQFKKMYEGQTPLNIDQTKQNEQTEQSLSISQYNKMQQKLKKWETYLKSEEENLFQKKLEFTIDIASNVVSCVSLSLESMLENNPTAISSMSALMAGLEFISAGIELRNRQKDTNIIDQWSQTYKEWQNKHQPSFKITTKGAQRKNFTPSPISKILSNEEHREALSKFIHQAKDFSEIQSYLKNCNIILDSSFITKDALLLHWQTSPADYEQVVKSYIIFQRKLEALDVIIHTSKNLLHKRQAILNKKTLLLTPHYQTFDTNIQKLKKATFIREMQQFLWQTMQQSTCTPKDFQELLEKWGFFTLPSNEKNHKLLQAFEQVKSIRTNQLDSSVEQQKFIQAFHQWMQDPHAMDEHFHHWYHHQPKENHIKSYIDHQETIEHTTKNALKQMVQKKHETEGRFSHFKLFLSRVRFSVAAVTLTISLTLAVLGLLSIPFGGAGFILLALSLGSTFFSFSLLGLSYYYAYTEKPYTTKTLSVRYQAQMSWARIRSSIHAYFHQAKEKKLLEVATVLYHCYSSISLDKNHPDYQKALTNYQKAKRDFEESQANVEAWTKRLKDLEKHLAQQQWLDFAQKAALQVQDNPLAFDTLRAFKEGFENCDFQLMSQETRTLLEVQLGINLQTLQSRIQKNSETIQNNLREFFVLENDDLISFIKSQKTRMKLS